eukprot:3181193-Karenia_brevis.AAC.1
MCPFTTSLHPLAGSGAGNFSSRQGQGHGHGRVHGHGQGHEHGHKPGPGHVVVLRKLLCGGSADVNHGVKKS